MLLMQCCKPGLQISIILKVAEIKGLLFSTKQLKSTMWRAEILLTVAKLRRGLFEQAFFESMRHKKFN